MNRSFIQPSQTGAKGEIRKPGPSLAAAGVEIVSGWNCVLVGPLLNTKTVGGGDPPVGCASTVRYAAVSNTGCIFRLRLYGVQIWLNV